MPAKSSVATAAVPEFDLGPLSWVQGEIGQSLARGLDLLAAFATAPSDSTSLKQARNHVHQAAGAIQMVGLDAVVAYTDEIERQLARLEELTAPEIASTCALIDRACRKLRIFLDELVGGAPPVPLQLFPEYQAMQRSRGVKVAAPTDLFYPELSLRGPVLEMPLPMPVDKLASHLVKQRRLYERSLLAFLRGDGDGARRMRGAVAGIERVSARQSARTFWWTVGAFFDAIAEGGLDPGFGAKQLAARIDLQIRRVVEGSAKVADRLRREVLYFVAISAPVAPSVQAVQESFGLAALIPSVEVLNADLVRLHPILREARDQLGAAKDMWLKVTTGRADSMQTLKQTLASVHANAVEIGNAALTKLTASLVARLDKMPPSGSVSEPLAMEYATGMLLAESAVENYGSLAKEFPKQVDAMLARLDAAQASRPIPAATAPILDEMFRRAHERMLMAQVGREIQANLRRMEQLLDAFFRDHSKRAELASLGKDSRQIRGALTMLGQDDAERLLGLCQDQIDSYANPETSIDDEDLELLAESLSGLGFYIEALEQRRPDRQRLIAPLLAKRLGEAPAPQIDRHAETVEHAVEELRNALPALVAEVHRAPADAAARDLLKARLSELVNDAKLIDDDELVAQAEAALAELEAGGTAALTAAVTAIAESSAAVSAPTPAISEETQRLLATDAKGLDAELLEIYLTEAAEVLDTIRENHRELAANPGDRDVLRTVRRQFHTLKGSGRMVGLTELGELAYGVEKIHNRLVEEERPVTPAVLAMIEIAERNFRRWIGTLKDTGSVTADPAELHAVIGAVKAELPADREPEAPAPAAVAADEPEVVELPKLDGAAAEMLTPDALAADGPDRIELPELGGAQAELLAPSAQWVDEPEGDGEESAEIIEFVPLDRAPAAEDAEDRVPQPAHEITIGDITLSADLHAVLVDEAEAHLATLAHELSLLQFDPTQRPSAAMVRASHTLCGIHRTSGLPLIALTAKALEQCLLALQQATGPLPYAALPTLANAVRGLGEFVARVRARTAFDAVDSVGADEIQQELEALRQAAITEPGTLDAETQAAREFATEESDASSAPVPSADVVPLPVEMPLRGEVEAALAAPAEIPEPAAEEAPGQEQFAPEIAAPVPVGARARVPQAISPVHVPGFESAQPEIPEDPLADIRDDVDEQVLPIFLEEAAELYPQAGEQVRAWRRAPGDANGAQQLRRTLHTFKGSARMAGAMRLGELAHLMEWRLSTGDELAPGTPELFEALDTDLDRIAYVLDALREGKTNVVLPGTADSQETGVAADAALRGAMQTAGTAPAAQATERPVVVPLASSTAALPRAVAEAADVETGARAMLRVRADIIDRLVNEAGEVAITRARIESELRALKANLLELTGSVVRLRTQVREIEIHAESQIQSRLMQVGEGQEGFDPLEFDRYTSFQELARSLAEGVNDVSTVQQSLLRNLDVADAALLSQARLSRDVQQQLFSIRTVPFGSLSERLYRILRGTAKELDKRANLEIGGAETELDRSVLEKLAGPLEHLLRNALGHGIEPRSVRAKAGKSETGEITLDVRQVGNEIAIELVDDGAGLNLDRIRAKAVAQGRFAADAQPTDDQLIACIFEPGFSTAAKVTQVSGRGIGMDVVRAEIAELGGRVEVSTRPGRGTTFMLYLPLTLAVAQAVLVRAGGRLWALPAPMVEKVQQMKAEALVELYIQRRFEWQGMSYPFHYLPRLLGDHDHVPESTRNNAVLLLRSGQNLAAVHVDEMLGNQEVVVKNIGPQLARVSGIAGATVLGNGEIVLIINPVQLAQRADVPVFEPNAERMAPEVPRMAVVQAGRPLVMIVDDSLTVRRITSRLLTREGFDVVAAKDGIDALELLQTETPDVILLDIEMPRMDGFEFTKKIRGDAKNAGIPIVMITSRTAEKHRNRAKELGVELYLGKPFQEDELLKHLREMLALTQ
jgi:chemosensory pili system protein ChpA (sensor histidine kinase/response regulator)